MQETTRATTVEVERRGGPIPPEEELPPREPAGWWYLAEFDPTEHVPYRILGCERVGPAGLALTLADWPERTEGGWTGWLWHPEEDPELPREWTVVEGVPVWWPGRTVVVNPPRWYPELAYAAPTLGLPQRLHVLGEGLPFDLDGPVAPGWHAEVQTAWRTSLLVSAWRRVAYPGGAGAELALTGGWRPYPNDGWIDGQAESVRFCLDPTTPDPAAESTSDSAEPMARLRARAPEPSRWWPARLGAPFAGGSS